MLIAAEQAKMVHAGMKLFTPSFWQRDNNVEKFFLTFFNLQDYQRGR
jgi:hypothetical protein